MPASTAVVSFYARDSFQPRGVRTQAVVAEFERTRPVELVAADRATTELRPAGRVRKARVRARHQLSQIATLDPMEPWSVRHLSRWDPRSRQALLVVYPFSPAVIAARRLRQRGIPYVVDASDPWAVTGSDPHPSRIVRRRRLRAETELWRGAAGGIVTTEQQKASLAAHFPGLTMLVRPNGCRPSPAAAPPAATRTHGGDELHLAHYGMLYGPRVDVRPVLAGLARDSKWRRVVLHQYGYVVGSAIDGLPASVHVEVHDQLPWDEVVASSAAHDSALVVGNVNSAQLPSKTIDYATLPIPRIAVVGEPAHDSIAEYVRDKPGWIVLGASDPEVAGPVQRHLETTGAHELGTPVETERWDSVARVITEFVDETCGKGS